MPRINRLSSDDLVLLQEVMAAGHKPPPRVRVFVDFMAGLLRDAPRAAPLPKAAA